MAKQIGIFGSSTTKDKNILKIAEITGKLLAQKKAIVFTGNTTGILGSAIKGANKLKRQ